MLFYQLLNNYIENLECTAKDLSAISGVSTATISRYRNNEFVPDINSEHFFKLCNALCELSGTKSTTPFTYDEILSSFLSCTNINSYNKETLRLNLNTLIDALDINVSDLCRAINYDPSTVFRFRKGQRQITSPDKFAGSIAGYISKKHNSHSSLAVTGKLLHISADDLRDSSKYCESLKNWLLKGDCNDSSSAVQSHPPIHSLLTKLNDFDFNEFLSSVKFDEIKVPSVPFQIPTSKKYFGIEGMKECELNFLKATVLSKSMSPVIMYSDMPIKEMAEDKDFYKKWMLGMGLLLKKGLHLHQIHSLDRSFSEMIIGLENWIPLYMTGLISPYYLNNNQPSYFHHSIKVSGAAIINGEAILNHHQDACCYLSKTKTDISYYSKRAKALLKNANSLMDIYTADTQEAFSSFYYSYKNEKNKTARRNMLSSPPSYTMEPDTLKNILSNNGVSKEDQDNIISKYKENRDYIISCLKQEVILDEISELTEDEFNKSPIYLAQITNFYNNEIRYTYEDYKKHLLDTANFSSRYTNYNFSLVRNNMFKNLNIYIINDEYVIITKNKAPRINFVIFHPKLCNAIKNF